MRPRVVALVVAESPPVVPLAPPVELPSPVEVLPEFPFPFPLVDPEVPEFEGLVVPCCDVAVGWPDVDCVVAVD